MTLRYWCFIGCLVHVSQHGQEIFVILGLHSWHCLLRWWHHWLGCWHYHSFVSWIKKSRPFNISKLQGKCCRKKTTLPWSCFRWKFLWRLRFMFVVELLAGWVVFLQFFETWRRWCLLENRHCLKQVAMVKLLWGMDIFAMREPFLCLRSATQEVFDQSENFWICIFWDVVFHLHHGLNRFSVPDLFRMNDFNLIFQVLLRTRILKAVVFWEIQSFPTIWMGAEKFGSLCVYCPKLYQSHIFLRNVAINEELLRLCSFLGYGVFCWARCLG